MKKVFLTLSIALGVGCSVWGASQLQSRSLPVKSPYNRVLGHSEQKGGLINPSSITLIPPVMRQAPMKAPAKISLNAQVGAELMTSQNEWGKYYTMYSLQPSLGAQLMTGEENIHFDPTYGVYAYDGKLMFRVKGGGSLFLLNNAFEFGLVDGV